MIKFLLEAHENMFQVSTVDESLPKIQVTIAPDLAQEADFILNDLATRFHMILVPDPLHISQGNY